MNIESIERKQPSKLDDLLRRTFNFLSDRPLLTSVASGFALGVAGRAIGGKGEYVPAVPHTALLMHGGISLGTLPYDLAYVTGVAAANADRIYQSFAGSA